MKKTRGKKRKVSSHSTSHKKLAKPVPLLKKYLPLLILIAILLAVAVILNAVSTGNAVNQSGVLTAGEDILAQPVPNWGEIIINFFNTGAPTDALKIGEIVDGEFIISWKDLIIALIVFAIILAGMYSIITLTSIFDSVWVIWVITVGLSIIASLTGIVRNLTLWMIQFAAGLGAIGIVLEIIIAVVIFIGLSIGNTWIAMWAAKRKGQKEHIKAITGANEAGAAITALKQLQKDFTGK